MKETKSIIVVGGGSAGWMTAAYLSVKGCKVTLIESEEVPIVGVGESTLPAMNNFCHELGLNEAQWMDSCFAIPKLGIKHIGWSKENWWHWFLYDRQHQATQINYINNNTLPKQSALEYGYHVDAVAFGQSLKPLALQNGCQYLVDHIADIRLDNAGAIASLITTSGNTLTADYYIDCTGWAKVLSNAVGTEYQRYDNLLNDTAIACPQALTGNAERYTKTYKKSAGWIWEIALTNRRGVGYVYSSQHISDEQAIEEYCEQYPDTDKSKIRKLKFTPEKCLNPFNKNVCAIGLSAGFIEPLEATSLFMTQYNIMNFYKIISTDRNPAVFNRSQTKLVDEIYLYILAHYTLCGSQENNYWKHYSNLEQQLNTKQLVINRAAESDVGKWNSSKLFFPYSWWALLDGYGLDE